MRRSRSRPLLRVVALVIAAMVTWAPLAAAASAGFAWAAIECCCGEHPGDDACGCPDCPSAEHAERRDTPDDAEPRMRACAPQGQLVTPAQQAPYLVPSLPPAPAPLRWSVAPRPQPPPPESPTYEPRTPPF